ncbi:MAG: SDR family oxidoreductase [Rhodobacteraceae bacterium]|nr:SDR family oxidoreductase [Paracoccaceae bacterium]
MRPDRTVATQKEHVMQTAIVTGATQGIGKGIATALLAEGCRVIALGRSEAKLASLSSEAAGAADRLVTVAMDIADTAGFTAALGGWIEAFGGIDHLVNAAGVLEPGRLLDTPSDSLRRVVETNFLATLELTLPVARHMADRRKGSIVTIGSNSGTTPRVGLGAYPASKAAVIHAMKCLGLELAEAGVRCNIVSPGSTDTEMQRATQAATSGLQGILKGDPATWRLGIPLGRMASVEDVAAMVLFLLSDRARHITMENIVIDGGATLGTG